MIEYNSSELYGVESIRYMKLRNAIYMIIWIIVIIGCFALMRHLIADQYNQISVEQSVHDFQRLLMWVFVGVFFLSLLWWFVTNIEWPQIAGLRSCFEQHSCFCSLVFSVFAFFCTFVLMIYKKFEIEAKNGHFQTLYCPFILPAVFVCLMYILPPIHIRKVILPEKTWVRWAIVTTTALAAMALFMFDFR